MTGGKTDPDALDNASLIIDRFGGIRPMSNKINVPVTTIQGWKKRGVIPAARRAEILQLAQENGIDLSDILAGKPVVNENAPSFKSAGGPFRLKEKQDSGADPGKDSPDDEDSMPITIGDLSSTSSHSWHGRKKDISEAESESEEDDDDDEDILTFLDDDDDEEHADLAEDEALEDSDGDGQKERQESASEEENDEEDEDKDKEKDEKPFSINALAEKPLFSRYRRMTGGSESFSAERPVSVMQDKPYGDGELSDLMDKIKSVEVKGGRHMTLIATAIVAAALMFTMVIFWPQSAPVQKMVSAASPSGEAPVPEAKEQKEGFSPVYNEVSDDLKVLSEGAESVGQTVRSAVSEAKDMVSDMGKGGSISDRIEAVGDQVRSLGTSASLADFMSRIDAMASDPAGRETLDRAMAKIQSLVAGLGGQTEALVPALDQARANDPALAETLSGVAPDDLKAAALLVGFSQFRDALERGNVPFDKDLSVLLDLVGKDNPDLHDSLLRLAPQAEKGVLTPSGLMVQFKSMAGEAVVASLQGEDVSFEERARARLNEVLQVEKNGELVTGTDTQAKISRARSALDAGDVEGAIVELEGLDGPAAQTARPWIDEAQAVVLAGQVKQMMSGFLARNLQGGASAKYTARSKGFSGLIPQAPVIHDVPSGVLVMPKGSALPEKQDLPQTPGSGASP